MLRVFGRTCDGIGQASYRITKIMVGKILSWGRVALLGIAQRSVNVKYQENSRNQKRANVLKLNMKTAGDWLKVKRLEKNLTLGHVAAKMGIAAAWICSWESSTRQPDSQQLKRLAQIIGFDVENYMAFTDNTGNV